jgi:hypothetical protein
MEKQCGPESSGPNVAVFQRQKCDSVTMQLYLAVGLFVSALRAVSLTLVQFSALGNTCFDCKVGPSTSHYTPKFGYFTTIREIRNNLYKRQILGSAWRTSQFWRLRSLLCNYPTMAALRQTRSARFKLPTGRFSETLPAAMNVRRMKNWGSHSGVRSDADILGHKAGSIDSHRQFSQQLATYVRVSDQPSRCTHKRM